MENEFEALPPLVRGKELHVAYNNKEGTPFSLLIEELNVPESKITVLIGPNGSGKTTLLKALNALQDLSGGSIRYRGEPVTGKGLQQLRRESVLVHQKPYIFRDTAYGNVAYSLKLKKPKKAGG